MVTRKPIQRAFIGTRRPEQLPPDTVRTYIELALVTARLGGLVVTGACTGSDQLAANSALSVGGRVLLVLPWAGYEGAWRAQVRAAYPRQLEELLYQPSDLRFAAWTASVDQFHPAPERLSAGGRALQARNYGIVINAAEVIALPSAQPGGGGTGQGMRIANSLGVRLYNLSDPEVCQQMEGRLRGG